MVRYLFYLSYIGTRYRGAQKHVPNCEVLDVDSIQGTLESALLTIFPQPVTKPLIVLSSRTDSGVHAIQTAVHANITNKNDSIYESDSLVRYLNRYMIKCEHDIRIRSCIPVTEDFHARYRAVSRTYMYRVLIPRKHEMHKLPILENNHAFHLRADKFDAERVKEGTKLFLGTKNFETFSGKDRSNRQIQYVRSLKSFTFNKGEPLLSFDPFSQEYNYYFFICKSKSFLYNQVRRMVGALLSLGCGIINEKDIKVMLEVPSHYNWDPRIRPAPSHGLYLMNVEYDPEELKSYTIKLNDNVKVEKVHNAIK